MYLQDTYSGDIRRFWAAMFHWWSSPVTSMTLNILLGALFFPGCLLYRLPGGNFKWKTLWYSTFFSFSFRFLELWQVGSPSCLMHTKSRDLTTFSKVSSAFWRTLCVVNNTWQICYTLSFSWSAFLSEMHTLSLSLSLKPMFSGPFTLSCVPAKSPLSTVIGSWHASLDSLSSTLGFKGADSLSFDATARWSLSSVMKTLLRYCDSRSSKFHWLAKNFKKTLKKCLHG